MLRSNQNRYDTARAATRPPCPDPVLTSAFVQDFAKRLQLFLIEDGGLCVLVPQGSPRFF